MAWHKLVVRNNWEYITVHIGGPVVGGKFGTVLDDSECPPKLKAGPYQVQWPDGRVETLMVKMHRYTESYDDMGHTYCVSGEKPYFQVTLNGAKLEVYAPELGVKVWRD